MRWIGNGKHYSRELGNDLEIAVDTATKTEALIAQLGWQTKRAGQEHLAAECCPFCNNANYKFYVHVGGEKDGMWDCKVCGKVGNYYQLKAHLAQNGVVTSLKDAAHTKGGKATLPDFQALHARLMASDAPLDYLVHGRRFSIEVIRRMKLGYMERDGKQWVVIPYFDAGGKPVFYKSRTVPPAGKEFDAPAGYTVPLYNGAALKQGMEELLMVEGEPDCLAVLSNGYETVVGVPGAGIKKADWLERLDVLEPKRIYLLYDRDKTGQEGARAMANRIGLDKVYNVVLPEFLLDDGTPGKDVNDWFKSGRTMDELLELMAAAKKFDIAGVQDVADVLAQLEQDLEERGTDPKYLTPWPSLTRKVGGFEDGDLVGIIAEGKVGKTTLALNWLHYYAEQEGRNVFNFCLEMPTKRTVRKWASYVTQTDDTPGRSQMTPETIRLAIAKAGEMKGDLLLGYTKDRDIKHVLDTIRQVVRRYGVEVVCFDHLHLLVQSIEHQAQEIAKFAIAFKNLAMELGILILLIIQPNRVAEGQIVGARNALGSSTIDKLVDYMICLHRNRVAQIKAQDFRGFLETEDNLEPHLLVRVDLARYAPGGCCTLYMDGATSTVRECKASEEVTVFKPVHVGIAVEADEEVTI